MQKYLYVLETTDGRIINDRLEVDEPLHVGDYVYLAGLVNYIKGCIMEMSYIQRLSYLYNIIKTYNFEYYVLGDPSVPDSVYDQLYQELVELETRYPSLVKEDSPTKNVGSDLTGDRPEVVHAMPMLSIDNAFEEEKIEKFFKNHKEYIESSGLCLEPKMDGLAIELTYVDGLLVKASTRGDGTKGEDVTPNALACKGIPNVLVGDKPGIYDIRGEVYMEKATLERLNREREQVGKKKFANCRNAAAGSFKHKDPSITMERDLKFICYGFGRGFNHYQTYKQIDFFEEVALMGVPISDEIALVHELDEVYEHYRYLIARRDSLPYDIDGMVIKLNSLQAQGSLGHTSKYYRGIIAYKFPASEGKTTLREVTIQVGRTGALTPVAELEPLDLHGVVVRRATLHNWDEIEKKDIRIGDQVIVQRAGDVIPAIVCSLPNERKGDESIIDPPLRCPVCNTKTQKEDAVYRCVNPLCRDRLRRSLHHFVSKDAFDIDGLGKVLINQLVAANIINNFSDILFLTAPELEEIDGVGEKKANNVINAINRSIERVTEARFLFSLGLRHVGKDVSKALISEFGRVEAVLNADKESLMSVYGIGEAIADSIITISKDKKFMNMVDLIRSRIGEPLVIQGNTRAKLPLSGKTFVITGTFSITRNELQELLEGLGGKVTKAVSSKTDYLLVGDKPGKSKINKVKPPTMILDEKELEDLLS